MSTNDNLPTPAGDPADERRPEVTMRTYQNGTVTFREKHNATAWISTADPTVLVPVNR